MKIKLDSLCVHTSVNAARTSACATVLLVLLAGCAHPPQLATSLDAHKDSDNLVVLKITVVNREDRVTVPIAIELTGQAETNGHWDKTETLVRPAAFVLNRKEQRAITKLWRVPADAIRTTLVIREQETGKLLKSEKTEKTLSAASTSQP
jgi:hypothetical protein